MSEQGSDSTVRLTRKGFLQGAAAAAAGLGVMRRAGASRRVDAAKSPDNKIGLGFVGVGGRGSALFGDMNRDAAKYNFDIVAICDVWDKRTEARVRDTGGRAKGYRDYRELLANPAVDAVVIATPDHWHSKITIEAMRAGKDVYCEKPLTLYWEQAKEVAKVSRETGKVLQNGAGSGSDGRWWTIRDIIKQGGIGQLIWAQTGAFRNDPSGDWNWAIQPCKPGVDLDWDQWLGHKYRLAPKRSYDAERYSRFRKYWDYSGGLATDLLYHAYAHLALAFDHQFPHRVLAGGGQPIHNLANDNREVPTFFTVQADFPSQASCMMVGAQECEDPLVDTVRGQKAVITVSDGTIIVKPQAPFRKEFADMVHTLDCYRGAELVTTKNGDTTVLDQVLVPTKYRYDHVGNWVECIHSRQQPTINAERAYRVEIPIALSVMSYRQGKAIFFDPEKEAVVDYDPTASRSRA